MVWDGGVLGVGGVGTCDSGGIEVWLGMVWYGSVPGGGGGGV